jgi:hypothetical protein
MSMNELLTVLYTFFVLLINICLDPFLASCNSLSSSPSPAAQYSPEPEDWLGWRRVADHIADRVPSSNQTGCIRWGSNDLQGRGSSDYKIIQISSHSVANLISVCSDRLLSGNNELGCLRFRVSYSTTWCWYILCYEWWMWAEVEATCLIEH